MGKEPQQGRSFSRNGNGGLGLGLAAMAYVAVDYLRHVSTQWHERLQPLLWAVLALASVSRIPFYKHWSLEFRSAIPFLASMFFMLGALLFEALCVRSVTAVLGLDWHQYLLGFSICCVVANAKNRHVFAPSHIWLIDILQIGLSNFAAEMQTTKLRGIMETKHPTTRRQINASNVMAMDTRLLTVLLNNAPSIWSLSGFMVMMFLKIGGKMIVRIMLKVNKKENKLQIKSFEEALRKKKRLVKVCFLEAQEIAAPRRVHAVPNHSYIAICDGSIGSCDLDYEVSKVDRSNSKNPKAKVNKRGRLHKKSSLSCSFDVPTSRKPVHDFEDKNDAAFDVFLNEDIVKKFDDSFSDGCNADISTPRSDGLKFQISAKGADGSRHSNRRMVEDVDCRESSTGEIGSEGAHGRMVHADSPPDASKEVPLHQKHDKPTCMRRKQHGKITRSIVIDKMAANTEDLSKVSSIIDSNSILLKFKGGNLRTKVSENLKRKTSSGCKQEHNLHLRKGLHADKTDAIGRTVMNVQKNEIFKQRIYRQPHCVPESPSHCQSSLSDGIDISSLEPLQNSQILSQDSKSIPNACSIVSDIHAQVAQTLMISPYLTLDSLEHTHKEQSQHNSEFLRDSLEVPCPPLGDKLYGPKRFETNNFVAENSNQDHSSEFVGQKWVPARKKETCMLDRSIPDNLSTCHVYEPPKNGLYLKNSETGQAWFYSNLPSTNDGLACWGYESDLGNSLYPRDEGQQAEKLRSQTPNNVINESEEVYDVLERKVKDELMEDKRGHRCKCCNHGQEINVVMSPQQLIATIEESTYSYVALVWRSPPHYYTESTPPLPDTGQWLLLALNEKLPHIVVEILRAHIIGLHHYLMLFLMLAFSVLFDSVKSPGLGLGARYMFTMAIGRLLRAVTFVSTILPSTRPWCASSRFRVPQHPHRWAQKYYVPYASDFQAIHRVIQSDSSYAKVGNYPGEYRPDWGSMSFLIDFLRPTISEGSSWYTLLKKAGGGCNDLLYSGHMLVAVLTAMAWTEAYGGWVSAIIWLLVLHSGQREIRERHHYSVDCIAAIYVGILLWKMTGFIWSAKDKSQARRLAKLEKIQSRLIQAAKDSDIDEVRELLEEVELAGQEHHSSTKWVSLGFAGIIILFSLVISLLAFTWTSDG
ncbi:hypothetical protein ACLOJK_034615 [Asimina triloba]